jgi:hypothetical protein
MENLSVGSAYFPIQNVYKMTYGDENETFEPVNGYKKTLIDEIKILYIKMLGVPSLPYPITREPCQDSKRWIFGVLERKKELFKGHG